MRTIFFFILHRRSSDRVWFGGWDWCDWGVGGPRDAVAFSFWYMLHDLRVMIQRVQRKKKRGLRTRAKNEGGEKKKKKKKVANDAIKTNQVIA